MKHKIHYHLAPHDTDTWRAGISNDINKVTCKNCLKWASGIRKTHKKMFLKDFPNLPTVSMKVEAQTRLGTILAQKMIEASRPAFQYLA